VAPSDRLEFWVDGTRALSARTADGRPPTIATRPDGVGVGAAYRAFGATRLEAAHRRQQAPGDSSALRITSLRLRAERVLGGSAWGGVERADAGDVQASHAAVLGFNERITVTPGLVVTSLAERRSGSGAGRSSTPVRALPFVQREPDRWTAGGGVEWAPPAGRPRAAVRGELHGGQDRRGHRLDVAADAPLGAGAALVLRHDLSGERQRTAAGGATREQRALLGVAVRPVESAAVDVSRAPSGVAAPARRGAPGAPLLGRAGDDAR
jgi:hypothetical protein